MSQPLVTPIDPAPGAQLRSGTAARLAGLPVTTLRVWERRYGIATAPKTPAGQRLYSAPDVLRLRLLRQLTGRGHAIGSVAALPIEALTTLLADASTAAWHAPAVAGGPAPRRVVVVGGHAAQKLRASPGPEVLVLHDDLDAAERRLGADAGRAATATDADTAAARNPAEAADVLLVHLPSLQPAAAGRVLALASRLRVAAVVVLYGFGTEADADYLRSAGATVRREPIGGRELARLVGMPPAVAAPAAGGAWPVAPRRFSDAALVDLAERRAEVACECLRHVAELVLQLAGFERYSADCVSRSPADAALHRRLNGTAGAARSLFEEALDDMLAEARPAPAPAE